MSSAWRRAPQRSMKTEANARKVRLIGESRKKDDRLGAQTLVRMDPELLCPVKHRSEQAQVDLTLIRARAGLVRARTAWVNTARGLAKSYGQRLRGCNVRNLDPEKVQRSHGESGATQLSASGAAEADQGRGQADRTDLFADVGRPAPLPQEPRRGRLSGAAAGTQEIGRERA